MELLTIQYQDIEKDVIDKYLLGNIFHLTNEIGYKGILKDGCIKPSSSEGLITNDWSRNSYGFKLKKVCLLNLSNKNYPNYRLVIPSFIASHQYIFILDSKIESLLEKSKSEEEFQKKNKEFYFIPNYECWYNKNINKNYIKQILKIEEYDEGNRIPLISL